jgi:hypothetical protein
MRFWDKSLRIVHGLFDNGTQRVRRLAHKTGLSKSRVPRLQQAMERRDRHPESWWWDTEAGRRGLTRLVVATLSPFGLTRGVGAETIRACCCRLGLETHVGGSPSALREVRHAWPQGLLETAEAWEHDGGADGEACPVIGAVDETFVERMMLVFMDLVSGSLVFEEVAEDRTSATGYALVETRLEARGVGVLSLVSDRAKAWIKLAEKGLACLSIPEVLPRIHDLVKSSALAMCGPLRQARQT